MTITKHENLVPEEKRSSNIPDLEEISSNVPTLEEIDTGKEDSGDDNSTNDND